MATKKEWLDQEKDELFEGYDDSDDIYNEDEIELLLEDDEISEEEEAFMMGYIDFDEE
ncbi:hypothetical protein HYS50_02345 [Candidatus Woesearchaeota archaeon]|nr:hypothetical protein [Candidatus Woesearchaeota archaeon]